MNFKTIFVLLSAMLLASCVSKKKLVLVQDELDETINRMRSAEYDLGVCKDERTALRADLSSAKNSYTAIQESKDNMEASLRSQIEDLKKQREQQFTQVGDLTVLSKSANDNINQTIKQMEKKDQYIQHLLRTKDKADSINLALALNLKSVLKKGIDDEDIEVKVDKTVVFINLSDKMLFTSGNYTLTSRADEVLSKIAAIVKSKPELEVMVEGYTDNVPIKNACIDDNWDLSVKRSSQVVKTLQTKYGVNPDKLIAAGRGEYNKLAENTTSDGRAMNRRTRVILLPKLGQFYDLLKVPTD